MQHLFDALREKYPGSEVRDVKFIVNPSEVGDQDIGQLDKELADMVRAAKPIAGPEALR